MTHAVSERRVTTAVVDLRDAARILGIGRTLAYRLVREGGWPTPVVRIGRLIKVPVKPLYDFIDGQSPSDGGTDASAMPFATENGKG